MLFFLSLCSPLIITYIIVIFVSQYYAYYDVGINMTANNGFLSIIVAPILIVSFYGVMFFCLLIKNDRKRYWITRFLMLIVIISVLTYLLGGTKEYRDIKNGTYTL